jgi:Putative zinc-finger
MTDCESTRRQLALLLYGELGFDEEERVESHLDACAECRRALERERAMHQSMDSIEITPSPSLLRECREDLLERLENEPAPARAAGWWDRFVDAIALRPSAGMLRPAGAVTLVALGFVIARVVPLGGLIPGVGSAGMVDAPGHVKYVERAPNGTIQIVFDETRQRIVSGGLDDQPIRTLLLEAARDPEDAGLRADTLEILNSRAQAADFRDALIYALEHDLNAGVRMKAMDGLKAYASDPQVRVAFRQVLLSDSNPGLRTQAIDLLVSANQPDREMVMTLQELMERGEQLSYVRERCRRILEAVNASAETY